MWSESETESSELDNPDDDYVPLRKRRKTGSNESVCESSVGPAANKTPKRPRRAGKKGAPIRKSLSKTGVVCDVLLAVKHQHVLRGQANVVRARRKLIQLMKV